MVAADKPFVVATIGTCRIAEPILAATRLRPLKRANGRLYGYIHTSKEALQQVGCLEGRDLPEELLPFATQPEKTNRDLTQNPDLYLVEVSTTKEIHFREWLLQINHLDRAFTGLSPLLGIFNKMRLEEDREKRRQALEAHPLFATASPVHQAILLEGFVHMTTREELREDLMEIVRRLPAPVKFVCHIDVDDISGAPLASRRRLCDWMRELCAELGYTLIDPTPHVIEYGRVQALAEEGRDVNHYSEPYKPHYGSLLFDLHCAPMRGGSAAPAADTGPDLSANTLAQLRATLKPSVPVIIGKRKSKNSGQASLEITSGISAYEHKNYDVAEMHLRKAIRLGGKSVKAKLALLKVLRDTGRLDEAGELGVEVALEAYDNPKALAHAARALYKAKRYDEASAVWRHALSFAPDDAGFLVEAARCELKAKRFPEAARLADAALAAQPDNKDALDVKALSVGRLNHLPDQLDTLLRLAETDPAVALKSIPVLVSGGNLRGAANVLALVRKSSPDEPELAALSESLIKKLTREGKATQEAGDLRSAVAIWRAVQQLDPEFKSARLGIRRAVDPFIAEGRGLEEAGDLAGSAVAYRDGLEIDPGNARMLRSLALALEQLQDWPGATETWKRLSDTPEGGVEALSRGARAAVNAQQYAVALGFYHRMDEADRAPFIDPIASIVRRLNAVAREAVVAADYAKALESLVAIEAADPGNEPAQRLKQKILSQLLRKAREMGDDSQAQLACYNQVLSLNPDHVEALRGIGKIHGTAKNFPASAEIYGRLTELEPEQAAHWVKLAVALRGNRRYPEAIAAARKAIALDAENEQGQRILEGLTKQSAAAA